MPRSGRPGSRVVLAALGLLTLTLGLASPATAATAATGIPNATATTTALGSIGSIGIRLVDAPVATRDDPRARVYIVDHLNPGTTIRRRIEVSNTTHAPTRMSLYAASAAISDGTFLGAAGHTPNDLTTWTTVSPAEPLVPAGGKAMATVTIAVPADAAPGEKYGVIWAEARSGAKGGGGVVQVSRVGIRLYLSVGPGGAPPADFTIDALTAERSAAGQPMVVATVRNTGGRALDMRGTLRMTAGPGGLSAGPFPASLGVTLGIGDTEPVSVQLDKALPAGPWDAHITLHSGLVERTTKATITFPDEGAAPSVATRSGVPGWLLVSGTVLLTLLGVLVLLVLRRRRVKQQAQHAAVARLRWWTNVRPVGVPK